MTTPKRTKIRYSASDAEYSEAALAQTRLQLVMMPLNDATRRDRAGVLIQLASIYWRQGKYPEATNVWRQVIELARQDGNRDALGTAYAALATTYAHSGDTLNALQYAKQGLAYSPHNVILMYTLANAFDFAGDDANAFSWLRRALTQDPGFQIAYEHLGRIHFRRGEFDAAEKFLRKALELEPDSTVALNELGNMYVTLQRYDEALQQFHLARRYEPDNPTAYNNIGNCYLRMGKFDDARRWFEQRVKMKPVDALSAYIGLGLIFRRLPGEKARAQSDAHFRSALEVHQGEKARLLGGRLIEHDARRALALTALDGTEGLAAWLAVLDHPEFPIVGPGPRSDWQFGLEVLAHAPQPPAAIGKILALLAQS